MLGDTRRDFVSLHDMDGYSMRIDENCGYSRRISEKLIKPIPPIPNSRPTLFCLC